MSAMLDAKLPAAERTYIINLASRPLRQIVTTTLLKAAGFSSVCRIEAVDSTKWEEAEFREHGAGEEAIKVFNQGYRTGHSQPTQGSIGCTLSHLLTYRTAFPSYFQFDPDKHCGVSLPNGNPCTCALFACKIHPISEQRAVPGRSKPYDDLIAIRVQQHSSTPLLGHHMPLMQIQHTLAQHMSGSGRVGSVLTRAPRLYAIVNEDDCLPLATYTCTKTTISLVPENWDILLLGASVARTPTSHTIYPSQSPDITPYASSITPTFHRVHEFWGLFAYAIKPAAAVKIKSQAFPIDVQLDSLISEMARKGELKVYAVAPRLFAVNPVVSKTDIQNTQPLNLKVDSPPPTEGPDDCFELEVHGTLPAL